MTAIRMPTGYSKSVQKRTNASDTPSGLLKIMSLQGMPRTSGLGQAGRLLCDQPNRRIRVQSISGAVGGALSDGRSYPYMRRFSIICSILH